MELVGRFELRRVLGRGAAATVYEARDPDRGGRVALKIVAEKLSPAPAQRERFRRGAQVASDLAHPNLVHVVETGEHHGRPFVAMELVEGVDLERVIRSGRPFPVEWTIDVFCQVCEGLHRAHLSGLVHGDLKPSDVRVNPEGVVKILDFGVVALKPEGRGDPTLVNGVHYRAPEVMDGLKPDARSDVFSAGAIFYELLASRKPFPADTITGVVFKIRHENPDPAALPVTGFSPGLESIILKALRRDATERFSSMRELRDELTALVREAAPRLAEPVPAAVPTTDEADVPTTDEPVAPSPPIAPEGASLHAALARARERGESELALAIVRRLLDIDPDDGRARKVAEEIEAQGREAEAEQLCAIALAYASDGAVEKAAEIAEKIERLNPWSPRYLQLQVYLDEERAARDAAGLAEEARQSLEKGDLSQALARSEEALALAPTQRLALLVREKALRSMGSPDADDGLAADLEAALLHEAEEKASVAAAAVALESQGRVAVRAQAPAATRKADVEILTSAALDRFLQDDHKGAHRAAEMALQLDPQNRKARELLKILGALG
ncbi:MAG TPA: protein kinase [Vicinamibacteria bacterium]|nr:protein kinase [Vicinamibacteria bacterium]